MEHSTREILMHFTITLEDNSVALNSKDSGKPGKFVIGDGSLTPNFERCISALQAKEQAQFTLPPEDVFGMPQPENIQQLDIGQFNEQTPAEIGSIIAFTAPNGEQIPGIVTAIDDRQVTVDFNHPLAGKHLRFDVDVVSVN